MRTRILFPTALTVGLNAPEACQLSLIKKLTQSLKAGAGEWLDDEIGRLWNVVAFSNGESPIFLTPDAILPDAQILGLTR